MAVNDRVPNKSKWERILSFSSLALIAANLVPLAGSILLDWSVFLIIFLFWTENLIIGIFNIVKISLAQGRESTRAAKLFAAPFFLIHYGGFCAGHGVFVLSVFGKWANVDLKNFHNFVQGLFIEEKAVYAVAALFLSHGLSLIYNYVLKGEYRQATVNKVMMAPYSRIVVLHLTIIFGALLVSLLKAPQAGLALLVVLKTAIDLSAHLKERSRFAVKKE